MILDVGNTNENADWTKTPENTKEEMRIHDLLAQEYQKEEEQD